MSGFDLSKVLGAGTNDIDKSILGMPLLSMIQKGSPEFDETHSKHAQKKIEGCKLGDIVFAPERRTLERPLTVVPLGQTAIYAEWRPRSMGGGFVGYRSPSIVAHQDYRKGNKAQGNEYKEFLGDNELIYTIFFLLTFQEGAKWTKGIVPFTATQLKHARAWIKDLLNFRYEDKPSISPPIFARSYNLNTEPERNAKGGWYGWQITPKDVFDPLDDEDALELMFSMFKDAQETLPQASRTTQAIEAPKEPEALEDIY